jgi:hypothetical protein
MPKTKFIFKFVAYKFQDIALELFIVCFQKPHHHLMEHVHHQCQYLLLYSFIHPSLQLGLVIHDYELPIESSRIQHPRLYH